MMPIDKFCRHYQYGQNMLETIEHENFDILVNVEVVRPRHNKIWGVDFILMDSKNFMGNGEEYEKIISMFMNIWNTTLYPKNQH